jgi:hypothetical protein
MISTTQMIYKSKQVALTCKKLLEEMHNQWQIAGNKNCNEKDLDDEDEVVAATVNKDVKRQSTSIKIRTKHAITVRKRAIPKRNAGRNIQS